MTKRKRTKGEATMSHLIRLGNPPKNNWMSSDKNFNITYFIY